MKKVRIYPELNKIPQLTGEQYKVLLSILEKIEKSGGIETTCQVKEISAICELHKNAASRSVKFLADNGYIKKEKKDGTYYTFTLGDFFNDE